MTVMSSLKAVIFAPVAMMIVVAAMMLSACDDHDSWADNYITDFADLITDSQGRLSTMCLDNGQQFSIASTRQDPIAVLETDRGALTPDSTYRCVCIYTRSDTEAEIANFAPAFAPVPMADSVLLNITGSIKTDPCRIQGIWRGGEYVNARMLVQGQTLSHTAAFVDRGITVKEDGSRILHLLLYHDQNGDSEAFTRTIYLSCPLSPYRNVLTHNQDSIYFSVNEYDTGLTTFRLAY